MSCRPGNTLEGELKDWVEGAKDGVVYVSFGSVVKAHEMPEERQKIGLIKSSTKDFLL